METFIYHENILSIMRAKKSQSFSSRAERLMQVYEKLLPIVMPEDHDVIDLIRIHALSPRDADVHVVRRGDQYYAWWYVEDESGNLRQRLIRIGNIGDFTRHEAKQVALKMYTGEIPVPVRRKPPYVMNSNGIYYTWWNTLLPDGTKKRTYHRIGRTSEMTREEAEERAVQIYKAAVLEEETKEGGREVRDYSKYLGRLIKRQDALKKGIKIMKEQISCYDNFLIIGAQERLQWIKDEITRVRNLLREWKASGGGIYVCNAQ